MARRSSRTSCSSSTASLGLKGLPDEHRIAFNDLRNLRIYAQFTADNRLVFAAAAPHITTSGRRSRPRTTPTEGAVLKSSADRLADVTEPAAGRDCRAAPNSTRSGSPVGGRPVSALTSDGKVLPGTPCAELALRQGAVPH